MEKTIVTTGKTIDLAIEAALAQLGLDRDSVSVQVLAQAKPGFLGFGAAPAKVQVTYEVPDPIPEKPSVPTEKKPVPAGKGYVRKRTFSDWMFEHVKLIATIATIMVVLSLVLITDVVSIVENAVTRSEQAAKEEITLTYVKGLSEMGQPITWKNLERFRRDETKAKDSVTWMLSVDGTNYELWISGYSTAKPPVYVYLFDMRTGDRLVLGEEDLDAFIEEHSK